MIHFSLPGGNGGPRQDPVVSFGEQYSLPHSECKVFQAVYTKSGAAPPERTPLKFRPPRIPGKPRARDAVWNLRYRNSDTAQYTSSSAITALVVLRCLENSSLNTLPNPAQQSVDTKPKNASITASAAITSGWP